MLCEQNDPAVVADCLVQEFQNSESADAIIELAEPIQLQVPVGEYDAICIKAEKVILPNWNRGALFFQFQIRQIGPAHGTNLSAYVNLEGNEGEKRKHRKSVGLKKPSGASKLARWWRILLAFDPTLSRTRVDLRTFKQFLYRVEVVNVEKDHEQRVIVSPGQYQVIREITAVVQRLPISR